MTSPVPSVAEVGDLLWKIATDLDRIATALEALRPAAAAITPSATPVTFDASVAAVGRAPAPAPTVEPAPAGPGVEANEVFTIDDVRRELIAATSAGTPAAVLLAGIGAKRLSDVAPENYPALVAVARAAVSAKGAQS